MKYKISILSDWHIGSGLSSGAESDANVLKDPDNLPYIPGKTVKGLFKAALMEMPLSVVSEIDITRIFESGSIFFSNAYLSKEERDEAKCYNNFLYRKIAYTSIGENGIALNHSLRTMEVCIPLVLQGEITGFCEKKDRIFLEMAAKWIRGIGVNRNRGMGRCKIQITNK